MLQFHKDQVYASSVRHHTPRWLIAFYFPRGATYDMGPSAIMPGSVYTSKKQMDKAVKDKTFHINKTMALKNGRLFFLCYE